MSAEKKLEWLTAEVDRLVTRYQGEASRHKKVAFRLRILTVFLSAIVTVLLGLKLGNAEAVAYFSNVALVFSAAISVLSAYEAFFDPRALWVRETVTFARLKDLQRDLRFWASGTDAGSIDQPALEMFKRRLDAILEDTLNYWMKIRGAPDLERKLQARADLQQKAGSTTE
jgi:hypothetical protein